MRVIRLAGSFHTWVVIQLFNRKVLNHSDLVDVASDYLRLVVIQNVEHKAQSTAVFCGTTDLFYLRMAFNL